MIVWVKHTVSVKKIHEASKESLQFCVCFVVSDWNRLHLPLWPGMKDSLRKVVLGWVSSVQYSSCSGFVWGQSLWQSLFLVSALQGGNSASDAKQWRIWSFSGEWCSEAAVLVPWFLSSQYISSTDLAKPFKNKNIWERAQWSEITAGLGFFPHCFHFPGGSNVETQHRDTELYSVQLSKWRLSLLSYASSSPCAGRSCKLLLTLCS